MTVAEAKARLDGLNNDDLEIYVLIEGNDDDFPVHDIRVGELEDEEDEDATEDVVFIMA
jgi:hypothetical protein